MTARSLNEPRSPAQLSRIPRTDQCPTTAPHPLGCAGRHRRHGTDWCRCGQGASGIKLSRQYQSCHSHSESNNVDTRYSYTHLGAAADDVDFNHSSRIRQRFWTGSDPNDLGTNDHHYSCATTNDHHYSCATNHHNDASGRHIGG